MTNIPKGFCRKNFPGESKLCDCTPDVCHFHAQAIGIVAAVMYHDAKLPWPEVIKGLDKREPLWRVITGCTEKQLFKFVRKSA